MEKTVSTALLLFFLFLMFSLRSQGEEIDLGVIPPGGQSQVQVTYTFRTSAYTSVLVSFSGGNIAGEGIPRPARFEEDISGQDLETFDVIEVYYSGRVTGSTVETWTDLTAEEIIQYSTTVVSDNRGRVRLRLTIKVKNTSIGFSQDSGVYNCFLIVHFNSL